MSCSLRVRRPRLAAAFALALLALVLPALAFLCGWTSPGWIEHTHLHVGHAIVSLVPALPPFSPAEARVNGPSRGVRPSSGPSIFVPPRS